MLGWIWNYQLRPHGYHQIPLDHILSQVRTGDLILFKALDNWNGPFIGCYFGHIGVVWVNPTDGKPYIFEAAGTRGMYLRPGQNERGIFCEPLERRVTKYRGYTFWRKRNGYDIPLRIVHEFGELINYAVQNMYYEYDLVTGGLKKGLGIEKCNNATNCGEMALLSLIKLGLLPEREYDRIRPHYLRDMCYLRECNGGYYDEPLQITYDPFS